MNFKPIMHKNNTYMMDAKVKIIPLSSPKKMTTTEKHYNIILDIILTAPSIPKTTEVIKPVPITPPPTRSTTPEPETMITRNITIYDTEYTINIPKDIDIYEGLRLYYPDLYTLAVKEDRELTDIMRLDEYDNEDDFEERMNYMDYMEWVHD